MKIIIINDGQKQKAAYRCPICRSKKVWVDILPPPDLNYKSNCEKCGAVWIVES